RLAEVTAVHHPALRRQRMQTYQRRHGWVGLGHRQLADEGHVVGGLQRDRPPLCRQHRVRPDLGHFVGSAPRAPTITSPPTGRVPMTAVVLPTGDVRRPGDDMRRRRSDLLIAAGTAIGLRRRGAGEPAYDVVLARPLLGRLRTQQWSRWWLSLGTPSGHGTRLAR